MFNMTSQRWLSDSDKPVWWHIVAIVTTANVSSSLKDWATLVIGGGTNSLKKVGNMDNDLRTAVAFSIGTGSVAAVVFQVPNQPMRFSADTSEKHRGEETMRAWTWHYGIQHQERSEYAMEFANLKAVIRAIDTVSAITSASNFVVTGLSKRGLVAWMAGAADARVKAIIPGCHDLGLLGHMHEVYRSLGGATLASTPYQKEVAFGLDERDAEEFFRKVDAYYYLDRLVKVNKFVMAAGNDDFFMVDRSRNWWDLVDGPKTYMMKPNKRHLGTWHDQDFVTPAVAFAQGVVLGSPLPDVRWEFAEDGTITAWQVSGPEPVKVALWTATTCPRSLRRDFRKITNDKGFMCSDCGVLLATVGSTSACLNEYATWVAAPLAAREDGGRQVFVGQVKAPSKGWRAGFIEFSFAGGQKATTTVSIMPTEYPFPDCEGVECSGPMVLWSPADEDLLPESPS